MKKPHYPHFLHRCGIDLRSHGTAPQCKLWELLAEVLARAKSQYPRAMVTRRAVQAAQRLQKTCLLAVTTMHNDAQRSSFDAHLYICAESALEWRKTLEKPWINRFKWPFYIVKCIHHWLEKWNGGGAEASLGGSGAGTWISGCVLFLRGFFRMFALTIPSLTSQGCFKCHEHVKKKAWLSYTHTLRRQKRNQHMQKGKENDLTLNPAGPLQWKVVEVTDFLFFFPSHLIRNISLYSSRSFNMQERGLAVPRMGTRRWARWKDCSSQGRVT